MSTVIAVVGQKGGAGKTTIAGLLAESMADRGIRVVLADADSQQKSLLAFSRASPILDEAVVVGTEDLAELHCPGGIVIIDTPGGLGEIFFGAAMAADLVVVPASVGVHDLRTLKRTLKALGRTGSKFVVVANKVAGRERLSRDVLSVLQGLDLPLAETMLHDRSAYRRSAVSGLSALPRSSRRSAEQEISALVDEILKSARYEEVEV